MACLAWDNIARGAAISCPHIEAALTTAETSDRVLGVSRVETVPSTTVHIFTGNSIAPRGDMASRSLMLALNVDRPDPENRSFAHADPLSWTQANRPKIVRALYTLLLAGALNRPQQQEAAKTRFKIWWRLVGWPMEHAASLLGITVNCTELMRVGEVGDEEASAVSMALIVLRTLFDNRPFTARDVVNAMTIEPKLGAWAPPDEASKVRAESIADALGELIGRPLDRKTAHSIGKLFQARLAGRPAWIDDGRMIATLRKLPGHNENTYRIEVSAPGQDTGRPENTFFQATVGQDIPRFPHIPRGGRPDRAASGNVGKEGNDSDAPGPADNVIPPEAGASGWGARLAPRKLKAELDNA